jgi:hypothetical protein
MMTRGLMPYLATPAAGEALLDEAVKHAARLRLVRPLDHVVVVQRVHDDFCVKIISVSPSLTGILRDSEDEVRWLLCDCSLCDSCATAVCYLGIHKAHA